MHTHSGATDVDTPVIVSLVGLFGAVLVAALTYVSTKRREREAERRNEKLSYYKAFVESMSGIVRGDDTPEGHRRYAKATNNLLLFAPQAVVEAVTVFREGLHVSNPSPSQQHDKLLAAMLLAIRKGVGILPPDDAATFRPILWASGADVKREE